MSASISFLEGCGADLEIGEVFSVQGMLVYSLEHVYIAIFTEVAIMYCFPYQYTYHSIVNLTPSCIHLSI